MSKLLTEPRITKQVGPKKTTKHIKKKAEDSPKAKFTIIKEHKNNKIDELFKVYKKDPYKARVKFFNSPSDYDKLRLVLFEHNENDFEISLFKNTFGISITNRIYSRQKKIESMIYKNGKFWHLTRGHVRPLIYSNLNMFRLNYEAKDDSDSFILKFLRKRFFWFSTIEESSLSYGINLNNIIKHKLYGINDLNRFVLKVPNNIAKIILDSNLFNQIRNRTSYSTNKVWLDMLKYIDNVQNLKPNIVSHPYFYDTVQMAKTLGRKMNCNWGEKKLKTMHNSWGLEIANIVLDCEEEYDLNIRDVYKDFAEYSGFNLLRTNKDMLREGIIQKHCVATYISQVNKGDTGIYNIDGYTLQLKVNDLNWGLIDNELNESKKNGRVINTLSIYNNNNNNNNYSVYNVGVINNIDRKHRKCLTNVQFKGKYNEDAPKNLVGRVEKMLIGFVNDNGFEKLKPEMTNFIEPEENVVLF